MHRHLTRELELLELRGRIQSQVQGQLSQSQREFYLREQLKAIQKELGEGDESQPDVEELREKLEAAGMPEEVKTRPCASWAGWRASRRRRPNTASRGRTWNGWPPCRGAFPPARRWT